MTFIDQEDPDILINVKDGKYDMEAYNVPLRFRVGSIEFFGPEEDPYLGFEVADAVPRLIACLRAAQRYGRSALDLRLFGYNGYIVFVSHGEDILICLGSISTRARFTRLWSACMECAINVRDTAIQQHPEVAAREWWSFITGDAPEDLVEEVEKAITRPEYFHELYLCFPHIYKRETEQ